MRKILLTAFAAALSVSSASADEFVVKTSSNGALTAGQVLDNTGTAIVVKSNFAATKNKDTKKGVFPDGLAASYFSVASSKMRLSAAPDESTPTGTEQSGNTSFEIVVNEKLDSLIFYTEASGNTRNFYLWDCTNNVRLEGEKQIGEAVGGTNLGYITAYANIEPGTYTFYNTGFGGGFSGIRYSLTSQVLQFSADNLTVVYGSTDFQTPELNIPEGVTVTYASSNESVATVDANEGTLTITGVGTTEITASASDGQTASYTLTVVSTVTKDWFVSDETPVEGGTVYIDNEIVKLASVYNTTLQNVYSMVINGITHDRCINVRVAKAPTADIPTGTEQAGSTPLVLNVYKEITLNMWYRRQAGNQEGNPVAVNDNKDLRVYNQADLSVMNGTIEVVKDGDTNYPYVMKTLVLEPGTYTIAMNGTTIGLFGVAYTYEVEVETPEAPAAPEIECSAINSEGEIEGNGDGTPVAVTFSHIDGAEIYYNFTPVVTEETPDTPAEQDAEPTVMVDGKEYTLYTEPISISKDGELSYFARKNGLDSEIKTIQVKGVASALFEINADENAPVEYFNLQGIRVANPDNGVFIRRQGNTVTKVVK